MKKQIKKEVLVTGSVEMKLTATQLRDKEADKLKSRGPRQIGQAKKTVVVRIGAVTREELSRRILLAEKILNTGKAPKNTTRAENTKLADTEKALRHVEGLLILRGESIKALELELADTIDQSNAEIDKLTPKDGKPIEEKPEVDPPKEDKKKK